ncbi:hypothetical protein AN958_02208 [Leucoagaricus sp. SymC.cos]|nr:hypothetical protein AN958_02208 [Leucoagaricus sp. SymC.cos]
MKFVVYGVFASFVITVAGLLGRSALDNAHNVRLLVLAHSNSCFFSKTAHLTTWVIGVVAAFNLFLVLMSIANALDMPRSRNVEVLAQLHREGARSFLVRLSFIDSVRSGSTLA